MVERTFRKRLLKASYISIPFSIGFFVLITFISMYISPRPSLGFPFYFDYVGNPYVMGDEYFLPWVIVVDIFLIYLVFTLILLLYKLLVEKISIRKF